MYRVDEIEDAILAVLRADAALASYVKAFEPISVLDEGALRKVLRQFPAIGIISVEGAYANSPGRVQLESGLWDVVCFNRNLRSSVASLRGGANSEKGLWDMIDDCRRALFAGEIGLSISECLARSRRLLWAGEQWAAASLEVEVRWRNRW
ncbi:MAG: phage protein Gp37 [Syntrophobacteraceae bacterium]